MPASAVISGDIDIGDDVVLEYFVLEHAELGLLHRELAEINGVLDAGHGHRPYDPVGHALIEATEPSRSLPSARHVVVEPDGPLPESLTKESPAAMAIDKKYSPSARGGITGSPR
jgi:hypothetical protein